jgi:D-methionine transport system substrate-binding protein
MKKIVFLLPLLAFSTLSGCSSSKTISVCASELPHAKILNECLAPLLQKEGYDLDVKVLDWQIQNDAVANDEYDANYFQHVPYLKRYEGATKLYAACKVHYEVLCLYAQDLGKKTLFNGAKIELVNDASNIERALQLLVAHQVLTINSANYDARGEFANFDTSNPNSCVTFAEGYRDCALTCLAEDKLCVALPDYDFGIIPGNTALTGLGSDYASRISLSEAVTEETISQKANVIAVKETNKDSEKTKALVKACSDPSVGAYIAQTFGDSVLYHFEDGLATNFLAS